LTSQAREHTASSRFGIAALQLDLSRGDNLSRIATEIATLKSRMPWVHMVVLGELATFGADPARAQAMPGAVEERYCEAARRNGVWLLPGSLYERDGELVYNTTPVIDPRGKVVARHRKLFPFLPYEQGVAAGSEATCSTCRAWAASACRSATTCGFLKPPDRCAARARK